MQITPEYIEYAADKMEKIAWEAASIIEEMSGQQLTDVNVRTFLTDQRNNILVYLPAALQIGEVLRMIKR